MAETLATVEFQLQNGSAQIPGIKAITASEVELVFAGSTTPAEAGFGLSVVVITDGEFGNERYSAPLASGAFPAVEALPAAGTYVNPPCGHQLMTTERTCGGEHCRKNAIHQMPKQGRGRGLGLN